MTKQPEQILKYSKESTTRDRMNLARDILLRSIDFVHTDMFAFAVIRSVIHLLFHQSIFAHHSFAINFLFINKFYNLRRYTNGKRFKRLLFISNHEQLIVGKAKKNSFVFIRYRLANFDVLYAILFRYSSPCIHVMMKV